MIRSFLILISGFFFFPLFAQVPIGEWQDYLPRKSGISLCEVDNKIYCITENGAFFYNKEDNNVQKLSKIDGLSGFNTTAIAYDKTNNKIIIGYKDGNIDIIENNKINNLSDIQRKDIFGSKQINHFSFINNLIYIATDFGIVVLDLSKNEFIDTYYIGNSGNNIKINDICSDGKYLYAATAEGVKKALLSDNQLANYKNWSLIDESLLPNNTENFNAICYFQNTLIASHYNSNDETHNLYLIQDDNYKILRPDTELNTQRLRIYDNQLLVVGYDHFSIYSDLNQVPNFYRKNPLWGWTSVPESKDAIIDKDNKLWYADKELALVKMGTSTELGENYKPNAPKNSSSYSLLSSNNSTWLTRGTYDSRGFITWTSASFHHYTDGKWKSYDLFNIPELETVRDIVAIEEDPANSNHIYCASGISGVIDVSIDENEINTQIYNEENSTLQPKIGTQVKIYDLHLDKNNNLWASNPETSTPINVKTANGKWFSFSYGKAYLYLSKFIITKDQTKWFIIDRGSGLYLFNENETIEDTRDDLFKKVDVKDEYGNIISNDLFSIAEDKKGKIWIGTIDGIVVYQSPQEAFNNSENFYASKIIIDINGKAEYLMKDKKVTCITIDGANRKWIGTDKSGVFLLSEDGTKQILHFNTENAPIPSDEIKDISIDKSSGEVFIATGKGLVSYRGTATEGKNSYSDVYAFPNPVKPEYDGPITITGLMDETQVKITDIAGNIVTEMMSEGGQAIWDGKTIDGQRVKTGVYLVFLSNDYSEETQITKILFIN